MDAIVNVDISRLRRLLITAFARADRMNSYTVSPWSIAFVDRTWDTYFELYYFKDRVLTGNTADKEITILTQDSVLAEKIVNDFSASFPQYKLKRS